MSSIQVNASSASLPSSTPVDEGLVPLSRADEKDNVAVAVSNPAGTEPSDTSAHLLLDAVKDARQIVRLVQCQICSQILQEPTTLPCGSSICRTCLPQTRLRANISWPATASRLQGFECPLPGCGKEHAADDCALDVTLNSALAIIKTAVALDQSATELPGCSTHITVRDPWGVAGVSSLEEKQPESVVLSGGRILATYTLVELGKLEYNNEVSYSFVGTNKHDIAKIDMEIFLKLKESVRAEMDCQVCYALLLDPVTTTCGHTYCRTCLHRVLDHSNLCPACRREISIQAQVNPRSAPSNGRLVSMINRFWADLVALRSQAYTLEQQANHGGFDVPIFVCTLSFPTMPLFLHVFEPRYRLMIRRAVEGDRTFGMVLDRSTPGPGEPNFLEFGVLLRIVNIEFFPDGRSLLETVGISRFRITRHGWSDGYIVANIEKVDDISLAEEESLEASEVSRESHTQVAETQDPPLGSEGAEPPLTDQSPPRTFSVGDLDSMPTRELVDFGVDFVRRMRAQSVHWLASRMLTIYGECPTDPATFPWWFACVMPVSDAEKYRLLSTSSVRERLKIACRWIVEWETSRGLSVL
ncbi:ATP-dependent protease La domain-containing protein [Xylariaceae sp. AK1471]|nr:ATP-dependent protease La domain-containing protein [Xylariaceae sp. AK1471]